jgi:hypothetical protein
VSRKRGEGDVRKMVREPRTMAPFFVAGCRLGGDMAAYIRLRAIGKLGDLGVYTVTFPRKVPQYFNENGKRYVAGVFKDEHKVWVLAEHRKKNPKEVPWTIKHELDHVVFEAWRRQFLPHIEVSEVAEEAFVDALEDMHMTLAAKYPEYWPTSEE